MIVHWTKKALDSYDEVITDIILKHNIEEAIKLDLEVESVTFRLEDNPEMGSVFNNTVYRRFVIKKLTSLFYRVDYNSNIIYLNFFWFNKDDPAKLAKMLRA